MSALHAALDLPPAPRSVPAARRIVAVRLGGPRGEELGDDAMTVEVHLTQTALQVAVVDGSTTLADAGPPTAQGGHGLWLVAAVADRWGSEEHGRGKRVWFELRATG